MKHSSPLEQTNGASTTMVDVCVMGGGAVASVAMLLAKAQGLSAVQILPDATASLTTPEIGVPRTYAIAPHVQAKLADVGVWDLLTASQQQVCTDMRVFWHDDTGNTEPIHLSAVQAGVPQLCSFVSEHDLLAALNIAMTVTGATKAQRFYRTESPDQAPQLQHTPNGVRITQAAQALFQTKLCLIAEGAASRSAAQLGLAPTVYDYGHSAVVAVLHSDQLLENHHTAWQWLGNATQGHDVLALLPMPPSSLSNGTMRFGLVWSQPTAQAQRWCGNTDDAQSALLAAVQARCQAQRLQIGNLSLHSGVQKFQLTRSTARNVISPNVVLLGDTAHKIHPLAGQGLNLGFEDVFTLFDVLANKESWRDVNDTRLLTRYQRRRAAQASPMDAVIHGIATRGRWPSIVSHAATQAIRLHNGVPQLGDWFKRQLVQGIVR